MNRPLKIIFLILTAIIAFQSTSFAAPVKSMSLEVFKDGQQRFWEVSVVCQGITQPRVMLRPVDKDQWCSSEIGTLCDKNKFSLSRQICADDFSQQLANFNSGQPVSLIKADPVAVKSVDKDVAKKVVESAASQVNPKAAKETTIAPTAEVKVPAGQSTNVASKENLLKEQMQIEEQRILIEQKRLELRRKQLELQKRQLNAS
jgi:hypothetical protein